MTRDQCIKELEQLQRAKMWTLPDTTKEALEYAIRALGTQRLKLDPKVKKPV